MKISLDLFDLCIHPQIFFPTLYVLFPDSTVSNVRKCLRQAKAALKRPKKGGHLGPFRTTNSTHAKREEEEERGLDIEHKGGRRPIRFLEGEKREERRATKVEAAPGKCAREWGRDAQGYGCMGFSVPIFDSPFTVHL